MLKRSLKVHWTSTAGTSQQYANIKSAKQQKSQTFLTRKQSGRKLGRRELAKIEERIEEAKKLFKEMCAAEILAWEEIDAARHWQPKGCQNQSDPPGSVVGKYAQSHGSV